MFHAEQVQLLGEASAKLLECTGLEESFLHSAKHASFDLGAFDGPIVTAGTTSRVVEAPEITPRRGSKSATTNRTL